MGKHIFHNDQTNRNIHFNKNILNDINYRSFETIGCKTALITNFDQQYIDLGFVDKYNCILYNNTQEMMLKLKYYLDNMDELESISLNGFELSKNHTFLNRAEQIVNEKFVLHPGTL